MCMAEQWCGDLMMRGGISGCRQLADDVVDCWQLAGCSSGNLQVAAHVAQCLTLAQSLFIYSAPGVCDLPVTGSTTSKRMSSAPGPDFVRVTDGVAGFVAYLSGPGDCKRVRGY